jgi:replicative DNA helicase
LNVALAGTGVGKSLFMCHMAANAISQGKNVLYITLEMSEERIAERIDANLMNLPIGQLKDLSKQMFEDRISKINAKIQGRLIVKEYPTASAHSGHFKALINELKLKRNFAPDIIFIDYLNICSSSRFKSGSNQNSYTIIKSIAEELRGLAVEEDLPIVTATQTTRGGYNNSDVELTDTSESFGLPATADLMFALISTEELEKLGQIMVKQLKNRYSDITRNKRFMIGVDRSRMKLFDIEGDPQEGLVDSGNDIPVFDKSSFARKGSYDEIKF